MPVNTPQFRMANSLVGGRLAEIICRLHADGRSFEDIARQLYADHGVTVTGQTLRRWAPALGIGAAA